MEVQMIGKCDSCSKIRNLIRQKNFDVRRRMCDECCVAANECERLITLSPSQKAEARNIEKRTVAVMQSETARQLAGSEKSYPRFGWLKIYLEEGNK
jgi:hypothetical protein